MAREKKKPSDTPDPWERQKGEGHEAFDAFCISRDMGEGGARRSYRKVRERLGKSDTMVERWARRYRWGERVKAWDDELDRRVREEHVKGIAGMRKRHACIAEEMLEKARRALFCIPEDKMTAQDIARLVDVASKLERISRGEATERTEGKHEVAGDVRVDAALEVGRIDLSGLTDEELEELDEIAGKLAPE